ncbi:MAG: MaoC family dehydratase [Candidatus Binatia bacterium]|nr:MaoC family dehydratase [Candidatus Binatia bacterium]
MTPYNDKPFEAFRIGDRASFTKTFTAEDVAQFAALCGDEHPAHRDGDYSRESRYGRPVVHGMLTASLLSTTNGLLLGTPGAISIEQTLRFLRPVFIGDTITATSEIVKLLPEQRRLRCRTTCTNQDGDSVLVGDALEGK